MAIKPIVPASLQDTYDTMQYAPAVRAGDMVFLSGVIADLKEGQTGTDAEYAAASEEAFEHIDMILKEAGGSIADIVDVTSYHVDFEKHIGPLMAVKAKWLPAPYPAWTLIGITSLYSPLGFVEIKVNAHIPL